jgi:transcriptional regulator with XRE-family HTH domain
MESNPDSILARFGANLRHLRKAQGFSQEAFADACGLDRTYIGGVERGERNIGIENVARLAQALGLDPRALFEFHDS